MSDQDKLKKFTRKELLQEIRTRQKKGGALPKDPSKVL